MIEKVEVKGGGGRRRRREEENGLEGGMKGERPCMRTEGIGMGVDLVVSEK